MLYSIVPPILVILSVIGIIVFLAKKAPVVDQMEQEKLAERIGEDGFSGRQELKAGTRLKNSFLVFLEKMIKRFHIIFLRSGNSLKQLGDGIRKQRTPEQAKEELKKQNKSGWSQFSKESESEDENREEGIFESREDELSARVRSVGSKFKLRKTRKQEDVEEKVFRPTISDHVVVPAKKKQPKQEEETKNRLEELLIERIAANPKDVEAYERLGEYYFEIKNVEHAKECFKQVLKLNPTNKNARYKIRRLERILGS